MQKKTLLIIAGAAVIALLLIVLLFLTGGESDEIARQDQMDQSFEDPSIGIMGGDGQGVPGGAAVEVSFERVLEDYQRWAQFPPDSRPLRPNYEDVIEHHWIRLPYRPMPVVGEDGELKEAEHTCRLQPQNHTVTEGENMVINLHCVELQSKEPVDINIESFSLTRYLGSQEFSTVTPELVEGDKEDEYRHQFIIRPRRQDWGDMEFKTKFTIPAEDAGFQHEMVVHFFSSPVAPAEFTGVKGEEIRDGSLVLTVGLNVKMPGRYTIEGNLVAEGGPVAHARNDVRFERAGPAEAELEFFGKIFHERGLAGPYKLTGLRGAQDTSPLDPRDLEGDPEAVDRMLENLETTEPHKRVIPTWEDEYTTRPYELKDFSNEEWDSEIKRQRIRELQELAEAQN